MTSHSSSEQLLQYLDGELSGSATRQTAAHLQACWSCQVEFDRLKQHIALIVDAEAEVFGSSLPPPPKPWPRIEPRLEKASESSRSFWKRLALFTSHPRLSFAYGTPALALLIVGILIWAPLGQMSAKEVLSKAIVTGRVRYSITPQQVVRQKVRIKKTAAGVAERSAALESWKSAEAVYWNSGADPISSELFARYRQNGVTFALPLSPSSLETWARRAGSEPSASSNGQHIDVEVAANASGQAGGLRSVSFHVNSGNWHMDQMTLSFEDATFQISEEESAIVERRQVPTEILSELEAKTDNSVLAAQSSNLVRRDSGQVPESTPVNLEDLEMTVRYALHEVGADLGEGIEIEVHPPDQLVINAAGASPQRKGQLELLLGNKPGVRIAFEEPDNGQTVRRTTAKTVVIPDANQARQTPDGRLSEFFGSPTAQENYARSVLQTSTDILGHLYAVRELADRWPPAADSRLSADSRTKLTAILRDHARKLQVEMSALQGHLNLLLKDNQAKGERAATGGTTWQAAGSSGLDAASTVDRTLRALLTVSDAPLSLEQALPKLQQGFSDLERAVDRLSASLK